MKSENRTLLLSSALGVSGTHSTHTHLHAHSRHINPSDNRSPVIWFTSKMFTLSIQCPKNGTKNEKHSEKKNVTMNRFCRSLVIPWVRPFCDFCIRLDPSMRRRCLRRAKPSTAVRRAFQLAHQMFQTQSNRPTRPTRYAATTCNNDFVYVKCANDPIQFNPFEMKRMFPSSSRPF